MLSSDRCVRPECCEEGFIIAPFAESVSTPFIMIPADSVLKLEVPSGGTGTGCKTDDDSREYANIFKLFHKQVSNGNFSKLVLSRSEQVRLKVPVDPEELFFRACRKYPGLMIMLFSTPESGIWLITTPEPLIEKKDGLCHTAAIAGTMKVSDNPPEWSEKNRLEQQLVEEFIVRAVAPVIKKDGPYTVFAGPLCHLKTDIYFKADNVMSALKRLHPTPAVCGIPQYEAKSFILENEAHSRRYYSGYAGPVGIDGRTSIYVSLRCAEIAQDRKSLTLYAGGGIMPQSDFESEFAETQSKMQTIADVL